MRSREAYPAGGEGDQDNVQGYDFIQRYAARINRHGRGGVEGAKLIFGEAGFFFRGCPVLYVCKNPQDELTFIFSKTGRISTRRDNGAFNNNGYVVTLLPDGAGLKNVYKITAGALEMEECLAPQEINKTLEAIGSLWISAG